MTGRMMTVGCGFFVGCILGGCQGVRTGVVATVYDEHGIVNYAATALDPWQNSLCIDANRHVIGPPLTLSNAGQCKPGEAITVQVIDGEVVAKCVPIPTE